MQINFNYFNENKKPHASELAHKFAKKYKYKSIDISFLNNYKIGEKSLEEGWTPKEEIIVETQTGDPQDSLTNNTKFAVCVAEALNSNIALHHNEHRIYIKAEDAKSAVNNNSVDEFAEGVFRKTYIKPAVQ